MIVKGNIVVTFYLVDSEEKTVAYDHEVYSELDIRHGEEKCSLQITNAGCLDLTEACLMGTCGEPVLELTFEGSRRATKAVWLVGVYGQDPDVLRDIWEALDLDLFAELVEL